MAIRSRTASMWHGLVLLTACLTLAHCSHDIHEKRADTVKDHVEAFYDHLTHDRVAAAVRENEAIEHLSSQLGDIISRRVNRPGTNQVDREWTDLRTANETAAQNWLALGQYLSIKKQYAQSRATYQRVIDTYTGTTERTYREQAARAIRDLDILTPAPFLPLTMEFGMRRPTRGLKYRLTIMLLGTYLVGAGCVHHIHVTSPSSDRAAAPIPATVQLEVPFLAIEGADHMPGIPLLEWSSKDLQQTIVEYFTQRQTFTSIGTEAGDMRLVVKAWLMLRAPDRYLYRVHLESDLVFSGQAPLKTYAAEGEALGSSVRWVTASDQEPIAEATAQALHQLATQIEQDREFVIKFNRQ